MTVAAAPAHSAPLLSGTTTWLLRDRWRRSPTGILRPGYFVSRPSNAPTLSPVASVTSRIIVT